MIVGGDYRKPNDDGPNAAITVDGGKTWTLHKRPFAYRSGVAWAKDRWIAVGTSGSDSSQDNGATWSVLDRENYNSVAFTRTGTGWAPDRRTELPNSRTSAASTSMSRNSFTLPDDLRHRTATSRLIKSNREQALLCGHGSQRQHQPHNQPILTISDFSSSHSLSDAQARLSQSLSRATPCKAGFSSKHSCRR
jgi:hypothetical protein